MIGHRSSVHDGNSIDHGTEGGARFLVQGIRNPMGHQETMIAGEDEKGRLFALWLTPEEARELAQSIADVEFGVG